MRSGGTLFTRGSKFRFSGRCQTEAYEASEHIRRTEPNFQRSSSLPNFARRHPSQGTRNSAAGLSDTLPEDRRPYNVIWASGKKPEAAVDVPRGLTPKAAKKEAEVEPSPVVKAPLAPVENYDDKVHLQNQKQQPIVTDFITPTTAVTAAATAPTPKVNGQAVREVLVGGQMGAPVGGGDADSSFETGSYQPNMTFYEDEEEEEDSEKGRVRPSLEEEIQQLDAHFTSTEQNHLPANTGPAASSTTTASKKSGRCGVCGSILLSVFVALLLFSVLFYILYFSGLQHPALTQVRSHLTFLEPVRDFVAKQANSVAKVFRK